jgi:hypothetical protein|tara:strand:+ start:465 stop:677 length:213 start_codon:yes stop_codon:yes gene_type:complete
MTNLEKFWKAIMTIKPNVELTVNGDITSQADFDNNIMWNTGVNGDTAIQSSTNPHSDITYTKVKAEMDKL